MKKIVSMMTVVICMFCLLCGCGEQYGDKKNTENSDSYTIEKKVEGKGSVKVPDLVKKGEQIMVTIEAQKGATLQVFKVNDVDKLAEVKFDDVCNGSYVIEDINENVIIVAEFSSEGKAIYAKQAPEIDGKIEAMWENAAKLYTEGHRILVTGIGKSQNHGYVSIMWDEDNLYFLGVVNDEDIIQLDCINFWISERYIKDGGDWSYSTEPSDGLYFSIVTPYAIQGTYDNSVDFGKVKGYECQASRNSDGYIVEMKIPRQSVAVYEEGHWIGFDVSIDTFYSGETRRAKFNGEDLYCYWRGAGQYWINPAALGSVALVK